MSNNTSKRNMKIRNWAQFTPPNKTYQNVPKHTLHETNCLPMKIPIFPGKYHQHGGFSMAMLVYRSVYQNCLVFFSTKSFFCSYWGPRSESLQQTGALWGSLISWILVIEKTTDRWGRAKPPKKTRDIHLRQIAITIIPRWISGILGKKTPWDRWDRLPRFQLSAL